MKRYITFFLLIIICFLLQSTVFHWLALADVVPNLLVILIISVGYMRGQTEGIIAGFICGLFVDLLNCDVIGLTALIYMIIGYVTGFANLLYTTEDYTMPFFVIAVGDFFYNILFYMFSFLLRARLNFMNYLRHVIVPELVYTVVVALVFYKVLHSINELLEKSERKEV